MCLNGKESACWEDGGRHTLQNFTPVQKLDVLFFDNTGDIESFLTFLLRILDTRNAHFENAFHSLKTPSPKNQDVAQQKYLHGVPPPCF